jgi:hypothetical protein
MKKFKIISSLNKIANILDDNLFHKEADNITKMMLKLSANDFDISEEDLRDPDYRTPGRFGNDDPVDVDYALRLKAYNNYLRLRYLQEKRNRLQEWSEQLKIQRKKEEEEERAKIEEEERLKAEAEQKRANARFQYIGMTPEEFFNNDIYKAILNEIKSRLSPAELENTDIEDFAVSLAHSTISVLNYKLETKTEPSE